MRKSLKISLIAVGAVLGVIAVLIGSFLIYLFCSPNFVVLMLRKSFGGDPQVVNPENYQEIRKE